MTARTHRRQQRRIAAFRRRIRRAGDFGIGDAQVTPSCIERFALGLGARFVWIQPADGGGSFVVHVERMPAGDVRFLTDTLRSFIPLDINFCVVRRSP